MEVSQEGKELVPVLDEKIRFQQEQLLFEYLQQEQCGAELHLLTVNLTTNQIVDGKFGEEAVCCGTKDYAELIQCCGDMTFTAEDRMTFERIHPQALVDAYVNGMTWVEVEYRRRDAQGNIRWVACVVNLLMESSSRELYAFLIKRDINDRKQWELSLPTRVERDPISHLYTKETAERIIRGMLQKNNRGESACALALLKMIGLRKLANEAGHGVAERVQFSIGRLLRVLLGHTCVIGQQGPEYLLLFWPDAVSAARLKIELENTIHTLQQLREATQMPEPLTFIAGLTGEDSCQADFDKMLDEVTSLCGQRHEILHDQVFLPEDIVKDGLLSEKLGTAVHISDFSTGEETHLLNQEEQGLLLTCVMKLISAESYRVVLADVFRELGCYFDAARVYQMMYRRGEEEPEIFYEWVMPNRERSSSRLFRPSIANLPDVPEAVHKQRPILLPQGDPMCGRLLCIPMQKQEKLEGFLCIDDPKRNKESTAIFSIIVPAMQMEQVRRGLKSEWGDRTDSLTGLFDAEAYQYQLDTMNTEAMASMGVLDLDAENFGQINQSGGRDDDTFLLLFAAKILREHFPEERLFRVSAGRFMVLYPDITSSVFLGQCTRVRKALDQRYPGSYSVGYTWSDAGFHMRKLLLHAEEIKKYNRYAKEENAPASLRQWREYTEKGQCEVFIQPKNRLATGEITGGEALIRCHDPVRGTITPLELIQSMEEEEVIQELDFYVLEQTLQIMRQWKSKGRKLIPISVNFSRQTLLNRLTLSATKEFCERYEIPTELIEIEITETLGAMERETIFRAVEAFRQEGFQFSLDDFGSEYSSITLLAYIPFHTVKLDKSLISYFLSNPIGRSIVESMVKICRDMGAVCIAEGVETQQQAEELAKVGCEYAQGYFYNKPLPAKEFEDRYLTLHDIP